MHDSIVVSHLTFLILLFTIFACMPISRESGVDSISSPLRDISIEVVMTRTDPEKRVAAITGKPTQYDLHAMDVQRNVRYSDGKTVLVVTYTPGYPAPWVEAEDGTIQHLPPIDATVESWLWLPE